MEDILSLCDYRPSNLLLYLQTYESLANSHTIYIGSEFCWEKICAFRNWSDIIELCHGKQCKVYFVLPILPERFIRYFEDTVRNLVQSQIDGFVVNDYGTLYWIKNNIPNQHIVVGRLLVKNARDYTQPKYFLKKIRFLEEIKFIYRMYNCLWVDIDYDYYENIHGFVSEIPFAIHSISYLTSTFRCDYKYKHNKGYSELLGECRNECFDKFIYYPNDPLRKLGNTYVYMPSANTEEISIRQIKDCFLEGIYEYSK